MVSLQDKKVLVLHPFLNFYGGAEYQLSVVLKDIVPKADVYTFSYKKEILTEMGIAQERVISPLGGGVFSSLYTQMTPLYPAVVDTLNVNDYDLVLSFTYGYVHGVVTSHLQPHISYVQTPMRLLWLHESDFYWYDKVPGIREVYRSILSWQRVWDRQAAMRPDYLASNSRGVKDRVTAFWNRESTVIYPPVDTTFYKPTDSVKKQEYFVTHSRLVRYKRIDIAIEACKAAKKKLIIIGDGPDYHRLKSVTEGSKDIEFTGYVSHEEKRSLLQNAKGFLFAADEDFGIAPVEALAAGTPVLAFGRGGVTETITSEVGRIYKEQTALSLQNELEAFEKFSGNVDNTILQEQANKFSREKFITEYSTFVTEKMEEFTKKGPPILV